jgi:hypothetical protein
LYKTPAHALASPAAYVAWLTNWQAGCVKRLRAAVRAGAKLEEKIKWGHLVYFSNGPVLLIRAEPTRVLFSFWRGKRLTAIEPRLKPSGRFELANFEMVEGTTLSPTVIKRLVRSAVALNRKLGDPTKPSG